MAEYKFDGRKCAIGACYFRRHYSLPERCGGIEVEIPKAKLPGGRIYSDHTLRDSDEKEENLEPFLSEAIKGIRHYAQENKIDLTYFDISLQRFLIHEVDSEPSLYFVVAQHALHSALAIWNLPSPAYGSTRLAADSD